MSQDSKIELSGTVEKIVRQAGKAEAQMVITIPVSQSIAVPLGAVVMTIQTKQSAMFGEDNKVVSPKAKRGVR